MILWISLLSEGNSSRISWTNICPTIAKNIWNCKHYDIYLCYFKTPWFEILLVWSLDIALCMATCRLCLSKRLWYILSVWCEWVVFYVGQNSTLSFFMVYEVFRIQTGLTPWHKPYGSTRNCFSRLKGNVNSNFTIFGTDLASAIAFQQ
jgi:hypothetical protein